MFLSVNEIPDSSFVVLTAMMTSLALPDRRLLRVERKPRVTLPDFMTRASLELLESAPEFQAHCLRNLLLDAVRILLDLLGSHGEVASGTRSVLSLAIND